MDTTKKRIRREYAPLNVAVSLACITPGSLPTQVFNAEINQYEADRTLTPCVIAPFVVAKAKDGSWTTPQANSILSEMKWLVNGQDITTLAEWQDEYGIDTTTGSERGAITIRRNITPGTVLALRFTGTVADPRTGMNISVASEDIHLSTTDKREDGYSLSVGNGRIIRYDPYKDRLFKYEYKVAHGLVTESTAAREAATDNNAYLCNIPLTVYHGVTAMTDGYTVTLYKVNPASSALAEMSAAADRELLSLAPDNILLDLRLITKADYVVRIFVGTGTARRQVAQEQFSINRMYPKFRCRPTNGTSIGPNDTERYDVAMVDCNGNTVECPEAVLRIVWKTDTAEATGVVHNEGGDTLFQLVKTGIGKTYLNDWIDVYTEAEHKPAHCVATDEDNNTLTDENGNILIFN